MIKEKLIPFIKAKFPNWAIVILRTIWRMYSRIKSALGRRIRFWIYMHFFLPKLLKKIRGNAKIRVGFEAWNIAMWKNHSLYKAFEAHPRFEPFVILTPSPNKPDSVREHDLAEMKRIFEIRGYKIYPEVQDNPLDYKNDVPADIIFYAQPYSPGKLTETIRKRILAYSGYGFSTTTNQKWNQDTLVKNITWKIFVDSPNAITDAQKICINKGKNRVLTGYIFGDELRNPETNEHEKISWKNSGNGLKKVIWAPHFSIAQNSILPISNFLKIHEIMLELREEFRDKIQWAFKPHPWLFSQLTKTDGWGEKRAKGYFDNWQNDKNSQLEDGIYTNLFYSSDAIIHDCGSFKIDWLYTQKPGFYVRRGNVNSIVNGVGNAALDCYYQGSEKEEIRQFLVDIVLGGNDPKARERQAFFDKYLLPPNGKTAAQNIIDEIVKALGWSDKV